VEQNPNIQVSQNAISKDIAFCDTISMFAKLECIEQMELKLFLFSVAKSVATALSFATLCENAVNRAHSMLYCFKGVSHGLRHRLQFPYAQARVTG